MCRSGQPDGAMASGNQLATGAPSFAFLAKGGYHGFRPAHFPALQALFLRFVDPTLLKKREGPGFPATRLCTWPRVRLSIRKAA